MEEKSYHQYLHKCSTCGMEKIWPEPRYEHFHLEGIVARPIETYGQGVRGTECQ